MSHNQDCVSLFLTGGSHTVSCCCGLEIQSSGGTTFESVCIYELLARTFLFITARVRSTREGNVLTRVCPSINLSVHRGGVPISHNALQHFPECHEAAAGGGVPISHNALQHFPECHEAAAGGVPISHNALQHFPECHEAAVGGGTRNPPGGGTQVR